MSFNNYISLDQELLGDLILRCVEIGISHGWGEVEAKWRDGIQTLLVHSWNAASLALDIMNLLGNFDSRSKKIGVVASFFHDYTKAEGQHDQIDKRDLYELLESIRLSDEDQEEIYAVIARTETPKSLDRLVGFVNTRLTVDQRVPDVCRLADHLLVVKSLSNFELTQDAERFLKEFDLDLEYHIVSPVRGITTQILHRALENHYKRQGFRPVLFFPEGTLYLGKGKAAIPQKQELLVVLKDEFDRLFSENSAFQQGGRAFGGWTAQVITDVSLILSGDKNIKSFWGTVFRKPIVTKWIKDRTPEAQNIAVFYVFYALKSIVSELSKKIVDKSEEIESTFQTSLEKEIGLDPKIIEKISVISHTFSEKRQGLSKEELGEKILDALIRYIAPEELSPESTFELLESKIVDITKTLTSKYSALIERVPQKILEELIDDIGRPLLAEAHVQAEECWNAYKNGKIGKGTPICSFCARRAENIASASLFGGGAESFSNLLQGGSVIGGSNKTQVCSLCEYEEQLRMALRGDYEEIIFVFPQLNLSRSLWEIWNETTQNMLAGSTHIATGLNPLNRYREWSELIVRDEKIEALNGLKKLYDEKSYQRAEVRQLIKTLEKNYEDVEDIDPTRGWVPEEVKNFEELAEAVVQGKINIPEEIEEALEINLHEAARINISSNPNFIVLLTDTISLKRNREESETTLALRKFFIGLLLSKLFHSSVVFPTLKQETLVSIEPWGAVYQAQKTGLKKILKMIGSKNGWTPFPESAFTLKYLAALLLCEDRLRMAGPKGDMGKHTIIKCSDMIPGQILNRYLQAEKRADPEFFMLLDILEEARRKAGFIGR